MQAHLGRKRVVCLTFIILLACISCEDTPNTGPLTFWEQVVSGVKNYPWISKKLEKESPETAHKKTILWQRLTMATVL
ncbi:hypothetical protein KR018_006340 [Drosophila ironensis]|nr:hypothetical protein KR018_006340 [Drosophila ironensis]